MENIRVVFMGTPVFAVPVLEGLIKDYNVVLVVTQPDKLTGRHQTLEPSPIKKIALENNIDVYQPEKIRVEYEEVLKYEPDIIITCAYGQIIPKEILDYPRLGCINVHASLLPKLRGGAPIHKAIIDGYDKTGITIMYMDVKMDNGDIIAQEETPIDDSDNLESLHDRLSVIGKELLLKTLPSIIDGTNNRIKQDENEVTFAYNIKREEEHIDFNKTTQEVFNLIRGLSPFPGAYMIFDDKEFKVYSCTISNKKTTSKPSTISNIYKEGIGIATADGEVIITDIKPFGKKRMSAGSYVNGLRDNDIIGKEIK